MKYHLAHATSITEPFEGQFGIGSSPFHGGFHVFKHSKADEMKVSVAEANITSNLFLPFEPDLHFCNQPFIVNNYSTQ